jgi:1-acyl-sn-glycerol-3-phosphate acyltransferase
MRGLYRWNTRIRRWLAGLYFHEIRVYGEKNAKVDGPTLFVSNHRNGAIDGYVLLHVLPDCRAIVGKNLTGSLFLRFFFGGQIEIYRKAETVEEKAWNRARMEEAARDMREGRSVLIFPEGTSTLGPHLLPIKKGAAFICKTLLDEVGDGEALTIVPLGLHYEEGWRFRSAVEVHIGTPLVVTKEQARNLTGLTEVIRGKLAEISENFSDAEEQHIGEAFASLLRYQGVLLPHLALCRMWTERRIPAKFRKSFLHIYQAQGIARYQGAPLVAEHNGWIDQIGTLLLFPFLMLALLLNMLPLIGAYAAAKKMADDTNVIALWRILVGTPLFLLQWVGYLVLSLLYLPIDVLGWMLLAYVAITGLGLVLLDFWRQMRVRARNQRRTEREVILSFCKEFKEWV